ncbi:MAG: citramalate synthase [Candidatus Latescibacteria bacterium]|nr:citramalate synthase [Candidatus Latescibacterota bacterium]
MSDVIQIYDSTLRDGAQAEGISFSVEDKIMIAQQLDDLGVHYIEGGWPNPTNPKDLEFFKRALDLEFKNAKISAFGSTRRANNPPEDDATLTTLLKAGTKVTCIFGKTWTLHVTDALRITLDENLQIIEDSCAWLKENGREVVYDAEHFFDGYKADPAYATNTLLAAQEGGAEILVLCDTNGGTLPTEVRDIITAIQPKLQTPLGIHTHNDAGMAVANSIIAVELGAIQVQGTFNGYGERCGNANLCSVIPNIELKLEKKAIGAENLTKLMKVSRFLSEVANVYHDHRQAYVGESAFAHKGGVHIDAMMKQPATYEHCDATTVGNERRYLLSEQSGGATMAAKLDHIIPGLDKRHPTAQKLLQKIKELEHEGHVFEAAEASFELLARRTLGTIREPFKLINYRTFNHRSTRSSAVEAIVKIEIDGTIYHTAGDGDGPVNALDAALRQGLEQVYPSLKGVHLEDYKVRVLSSAAGTAAKVRVLIETSDTKHTWSTVGVSENIIEASWIALVDSFTYKLMIDGLITTENKTV